MAAKTPLRPRLWAFAFPLQTRGFTLAVHYCDDYHLGLLGIDKVKTKVAKNVKTKAEPGIIPIAAIPVMGVSDAAEVIIEGE